MQNDRDRIVRLLIAGLVMAVVVNNPAASQQVEPAPVPDVPVSDTPPDDRQRSGSGPQRDDPAIRFTPSEKIRADDAVPFPVDI